MEETSISFKYLTAVYYAVCMLGGNELGPVTTFESFFIASIMLSGAIINANIFGEMAVLVTIISRKSTMFQAKVDTANTAMDNIMLPHHLQGKIRDYFLFTQATLDQQVELDKFLELISPSLKLKVYRHIFTEVLQGNNVIKSVMQESSELRASASKLIKMKSMDADSNQDFIQDFVSKLGTVLNVPEDQVVRQDDESNIDPVIVIAFEMYFIAKGDCAVYVRDEKKKDHKVRILKKGDHFGVTISNFIPIGNIDDIQVQEDGLGGEQELQHDGSPARGPLQGVGLGVPRVPEAPKAAPAEVQGQEEEVPD